jgi:hypothetical protein
MMGYKEFFTLNKLYFFPCTKELLGRNVLRTSPTSATDVVSFSAHPEDGDNEGI